MKKKSSFLILTADAGFGHRVVANAVSEALCKTHPDDCECVIYNPLEDRRSPFLIRLSQRNYDKTVRESRSYFKLSYDATMLPIIRWATKKATSLFLERMIADQLEEVQPGAILSTYLLYQSPLQTVLTHKNTRTPFFTVITDLANIHPLWYQPCPDLLFVPNEEVRRQAARDGIPEERMITSGIPVHPDYSQRTHSKEDLRKELGWETDITTLLAVGSRRVTNLAGSLEAINWSGLPLQLAVVAGGDDALYHHLLDVPWRVPVHLYNYVSEIPQMMQAADILLSKAGGLITTEGLACGLPIILIDYIPGQENGNVAFVCGNRAGIYAASPEELCQSLERWLKNDQAELNQVAEHSRRIGRPQAAYQVAELLWQAACSR